MLFTEMEYKRPDIEQIRQQFDSLLESFNNADSAKDQEKVIDQINELRNHISTMGTLASVRNSIDSNDEFYDRENTFFDENSPIFQSLEARFYKALDNSEFKNELEKKYGTLIFDIANLEMKTFSEKIMDDLKKENELVTKYNKLTSKAKIMFDGKERNLSDMAPFTQSPDRETRKNATEALYSFFEDNEKEFDSIYDRLVRLRTEIAKKLGYDNFIQLAYDRLQRSDYDKDMVANYRRQVYENIVPLAEKLKKRQAKRIGIDKMKVYDESFSFASGNPTPKGSTEEIVDNAKKMYSELSPETDEFFKFMTGNQLMDLESKKGKRPGGYCTFIPDYKSPFIFSNFNGTKHDVDVLTHEAGHAFQSFRSRELALPEYQFPTLEACEIHSMSMEFFAWPWIELFFKEDTDKYKFSHIADSLLFLPYGVTVDEFQHWVYENPEASPSERKQKWSEIEKKYMPWLDNAGIPFLEKGGRWQKQLHIYCVPFYYIDYTLAQVCAFQFWAKNQKDHDSAWKDYLNLCNAGGSKSFTALVDLAGLKVPFEDGCLDEVIPQLEKYLDSVDDMNL